ncbi:MAG: S-adenosylmethionine:tRNA ribosyltransferase-isomerase [Sandaracinus sp.]
MIAASEPSRIEQERRLLRVDASGVVHHHARRDLARLLRPGDVVVANDAATLPASLRGVHAPTGRAVEVRLAARRSLDARDASRFRVVLFGEGDHRQRTEDRPAPPRVEIGDRLVLAEGTLEARITAIDHPRLVDVHFEGSRGHVWEALARHGRPIQYAHVPAPLRLWDVWTKIAGPPVAIESPSAGFALDFRMLASLRARGAPVHFLTHAAGLSSTGDAALDALFPLDEPYEIPAPTALAVRRAQREGRRVVAIGTTVARALESSAREHGEVRPGAGLATLRIDAHTPLHVVDVLLSGTHERGTSHHALLAAFTDEDTLARTDEALERERYLTHEFGDSVLVERRARPLALAAAS